MATSVLSLVLMTNYMFDLPFDIPMALFAYSGTVFGYNFTKYESLYRLKKPVSRQVSVILWLSIAALVAAGVAFLYLERLTQLTAIAFLGLTLLYTVPFFPKRTNMRNWSGIKIYIVALCWAGVTRILPLQNAGIEPYLDVYLKFVQRFLLVIILILIFEIIDLAEDDPHLRTLPQAIGVKNTKILNLVLLIPFYFLEFLKININNKQLLVNILLILIVALFTIYAHPRRHKMFTLFWVESIPILWLCMIMLINYFL